MGRPVLSSAAADRDGGGRRIDSVRRSRPPVAANLGRGSQTCHDRSDHISHGKILPASAAGSVAAARGNALARCSCVGHSCAALSPSWIFGSTSDSSAGAATPRAFNRSAAGAVGNSRHCTAGAVARRVLSTRPCRTIHAATARSTFGSLLRGGARRPDRFARPRLGTRRRCRSCRW